MIVFTNYPILLTFYVNHFTVIIIIITGSPKVLHLTFSLLSVSRKSNNSFIIQKYPVFFNISGNLTCQWFRRVEEMYDFWSIDIQFWNCAFLGNNQFFCLFQQLFLVSISFWTYLIFQYIKLLPLVISSKFSSISVTMKYVDIDWTFLIILPSFCFPADLQ